MSDKPLLSICIPTFSRADLLEPMLESLCPQVAELEGEVEIVVSDNCSPDRTPDVVAAAQGVWPISYFRNDRNVGSPNMLLAVERARGEYCWLLGDDDMVAQGSLRRIIDTIHDQPDVGFIFLNYAIERVEVRDKLIREEGSRYEPPLERCICTDGESRRLDSWERLFDIAGPARCQLNTSLSSGAFRRCVWLKYCGTLRFNGAPHVSAMDRHVDDLFPHLKIWAQAFTGRPVFYVGSPNFLMGSGGQPWLSDWPVISMMGINEALELYEELGFDGARMRRLWRSFFEHCAAYMPVIGGSRDMPCLDDFSFVGFAWRNRRRRDVLARVVARRSVDQARTWLASKVPPPLWAPIRGTYRAAREAAMRARGGTGDS